MSQVPEINIACVGLGGIGSWVLQGLTPFISYQKDISYSLTLCDGDEYEEKNRSRQAFSEYGPKADVQARWVNENWPVVALPVSEFLTPENVERVLGKSQIIFSCLDNHKTRKLISDHVSTREEGGSLLISGGNDLLDGNVQFMVNFGGHLVTPDLGKYHPEIASPTDKSPHEMSCEELATSSPQIIFTNLMAASLMLNVFYQFTKSPNFSLEKSEIYFDNLTNRTMPRIRK